MYYGIFISYCLMQKSYPLIVVLKTVTFAVIINTETKSLNYLKIRIFSIDK